MKTNSTAKIYTELTFRKVTGSWASYPEVILYPQNGNAQSGSITIKADPNSFRVNQQNINVTYTIITKNNINGTFEIFTGSWGILIHW